MQECSGPRLWIPVRNSSSSHTVFGINNPQRSGNKKHKPQGEMKRHFLFSSKQHQQLAVLPLWTAARNSFSTPRPRPSTLVYVTGLLARTRLSNFLNVKFINVLSRTFPLIFLYRTLHCFFSYAISFTVLTSITSFDFVDYLAS